MTRFVLEEEPVEDELVPEEEISPEEAPTGPLIEELPELTPTEKRARHGVRSAARIFETAAGFPGDIASLIFGAGRTVKKGITGKEPITYEELQKKAPFPLTSAQIRELGKTRIGEELEPVTPGEVLSDEIVSDFTSLLLPFGKLKTSLTRAAGMVVGSNLAKEGVKKLGVEEKGQFATKLGTMFLLGTVFRGKAKQLGSALYKERDALVSKKATMPVSQLENFLKNTREELEYGGMTESKTKIDEFMSGMQKKISDGKMKLKDIVEYKKNINETFGAPDTREYAENIAGPITKRLNNAIEVYGKDNPAFLKAQKAADGTHAAIKASEKASDFVTKKVGEKYKWLGILTGLVKAPKTMALGIPAYFTSKFLVHVNKSPTLRKYYLNILNNSIKENLPAVLRNFKKLDEELKEEGLDPEEMLEKETS